ncbi:hypothetical protein PilKf_00457 [Pillotina sp. SPG140]|jgi:hypothetical protein
MKKLVNILFRSLPNGAHYDFCGSVAAALAAAGTAVKTALGVLIAQFSEWLAKEDALMRWAYKSALTPKIADADRILDHSLSAVSTQVHSALYSTDHDVVAAAERVRIILKKYGDVSNKAYNDQAGDVKAILENLDGDYAADVNKLELGPRCAELQNAYNEFAELLKERDAAQLEKPAENFREVRRGIEDVYHNIADIVNANALLGSSPEFGAFIDALNPEIERLNREFHHAKQDIAGAEPAPIPQQAYTGRPITPLPLVLFVTPKGTETLVLGKDYNLTYRNNTEVGNAQCTLHGKGAYRGAKTVTFIIAR